MPSKRDKPFLFLIRHHGTIADSYFAPAEDSGDHPQQPHTLPPLVDIPLDEVNRHLYARSRTSDCYM